MQGVSLTKKDGALKESVIKLNYIFTISEKMVEKFLFRISHQKKKEVKDELMKKIN